MEYQSLLHKKLYAGGFIFTAETTPPDAASKKVLLDNIKPTDSNCDIYTLNCTISKRNFSKFDIVFMIGGGRNWIIADRVLLGFQIETGFTPASLFNNISDGIVSSRYNKYNENESNSTIVNRFNFTNELLKVSLNIGFLAF